MVSRSYEESDYRRGPPNVRGEFNQSGRGGRDDGDYYYPPPVYGRENAGPDERYPQRGDYGYRDADATARGGGGEFYRGYEGRGNHGYAGEQGYGGGRSISPGPHRRGAGPYDESPAYRQRGLSSAYGARGDAGYDDAGSYAGEERAGPKKSRQFDPDYHQWREAQLSALDDDYRAWRGERYQKFADEFSQWRSGRSRPEEESRGKGGEKENSGKSK